MTKDNRAYLLLCIKCRQMDSMSSMIEQKDGSFICAKCSIGATTKKGGTPSRAS